VDTDVIERLRNLSPDDLFIQRLLSLGISVWIAVIVMIAFLVKSWLDWIKAGYRVLTATRRRAERLSGLRPVRGVVSLFFTLLVPTAQVLIVGLCYVAGNYIAVIFDRGRQIELEAAYASNPYLTYDLEQPFKFLTPNWMAEAYSTFSPYLRWDWISGSYLLIAVVIITKSYRWAMKPDDDALRIAGCIPNA
jgi:hypothetical protein